MSHLSQRVTRSRFRLMYHSQRIHQGRWLRRLYLKRQKLVFLLRRHQFIFQHTTDLWSVGVLSEIESLSYSNSLENPVISVSYGFVGKFYISVTMLEMYVINIPIRLVLIEDKRGIFLTPLRICKYVRFWILDPSLTIAFLPICLFGFIGSFINPSERETYSKNLRLVGKVKEFVLWTKFISNADYFLWKYYHSHWVWFLPLWGKGYLIHCDAMRRRKAVYSSPARYQVQKIW